MQQPNNFIIKSVVDSYNKFLIKVSVSNNECRYFCPICRKTLKIKSVSNRGGHINKHKEIKEKEKWRESVLKYSLNWYFFAKQEVEYFMENKKPRCKSGSFNYLEIDNSFEFKEYVVDIKMMAEEQQLEELIKSMNCHQNGLMKRNDELYRDIYSSLVSMPPSVTAVNDPVQQEGAQQEQQPEQQEGAQQGAQQEAQPEQQPETQQSATPRNEEYISSYKNVLSLLKKTKEEAKKAKEVTKPFPNEKEKKEFVTDVIAGVCAARSFSTDDVGATVNLINYISDLYNVGVVFNCRYSTCRTRAIRLGETMYQTLRKRLEEVDCYNLAFDGQSDNRGKHVGLTCRYYFEDEMYEEKIAVDEYYGSGDGESYCSYIDDKLSELGDILWKCTGITTDGASNMTGDYKGLQSRLRAKVEEQLNLRRMDLLLMFIAFYCMPHRHNLCIEKFCELELVMLLLDVATWLGSNKADSWRQFAKRNNINTIPKKCDTRWTYCYDVVHYIFVNYDSINKFIIEYELGSDFSTYMTNKGHDTEIFFKCYMKMIINAIDSLLCTMNELNKYLQTRFLTGRLAYDAIIDHIGQMYSCINDLLIFKQSHEVKTGSLMESYMSEIVNFQPQQSTTQTSDIIDSFVSLTVDTIIEYASVYLSHMKEKFFFIEDSVTLSKVTTKQLESFSEFEEESKEYNTSHSVLFNMIELIKSFEQEKYQIPSTLPTVIQEQYSQFLVQFSEEKRRLPFLCRFKLADCLRHFGKEKYYQLYRFVVAVDCNMASSCSVESAFSQLKNTYKPNMSNELCNAELAMKDL